MNKDDDYLAKKRERLLEIIAKESPDRKPGARLRAWENNREAALEELRRLDAGEVKEETALVTITLGHGE